jgi:HemY protein
MELESGEPDEARALAIEAHKLAPALVPAATTAARLFVRASDIRRATRILEATWKVGPHRELADAYASVRPGDSVRDRLKRVKRLAELRPGHPESAMAVARAAIDARDWQEARTALGGVMRANPTERVCLLMAEIEEGEHGDQGRVRAWLTRALGAPRDPAWVADGQVFERWAPVSPISGRIDAYEWRVAADRLPVRPVFEIDSGPEPYAEAGPAAIEMEPVMIPARGTAVRSVDGGGRQPAAAMPAMAAGPARGARPMARAPDDPGPMDGNDDAADSPVFRPGRTA